MEQWMVALFIFGAVVAAMIGQGWMSMLEHQRRKQAMEVIKAALEAGKEAPPIIYEQLRDQGLTGKAPWSEVVVFTALSFGFWVAYGTADEASERTAFLVVAATMTVTALGCLGLALMRPGARKDDDAG
jgi:alpha/beta superfamily hydrolase